MIKALVIDDHPIVRRGLKQSLSETEDICVEGEAGDGPEAMSLLREMSFDVILLDISLPGKGGIEILKHIKSTVKSIPVLMLSTHPEDQYAIRSIRAGASGYITKSADQEDLVKAIKKVTNGGKFISETLAEKLAFEVGIDNDKPLHESLSDREYEVMCKIASGKSVSQIGDEMALSVKTISTYRSRILEKMNMKNNSELTHYTIKNSLLD